MPTRFARIYFIFLLPVFLSPLGFQGRALAQRAPTETDRSTEGIKLDFPENMEIKALVQYVSQRLGINILYDEQIGNRRVTIQTPQSIPQDSLLGLLESALRMKGLALVDGEQPGWKRIVPAANLAAIALSPDETDQRLRAADASKTTAVTRVFQLTHADAKQAEAAIKPFLTQPGANTLSLDSQRVLIVTDYMSNMPRLAQLVRLIDQPGQQVVIRVLTAQHQEAAGLAQEAQKTMQAKLNAEARVRGSGQPSDGVVILHHERTNQVVVVGPQNRVGEAIDLLESLDVSLDLTPHVYRFQVASPQRVDELAQELIGPVAAKTMYRSVADEDAKMLVVTATPQIHDRIESLKAELDVAAPESQSPIRIYKLVNATAADVLDTIRAIETDDGLYATVGPDATPAPGQAPLSPQRITPPPAPPTAQGLPATGPRQPQPPPDASGPAPHAVRSNRATVTADVNTNSIIVVADPQTQVIYERLIRVLDQRRPQVLIEITIATINTTDDFELGVDIAAAGRAGATRLLSLSSFGISDVAEDFTGAISIDPGRGFNGAVLESDIADVVIRALKTDTKANVLSAPKILVNDNATGTLTSVEEQPTEATTVTQGNPTLTSFSGFVEAGTTISVTPHISDGDYLSLEYSISLNSFTGSGGDGIPAPRQTDSVESEVTVPDGHTIIVGGLTRKTFTQTVEAVPILGQIPLLKYLFSRTDQKDSQTTLFVFLRPVILRDDLFEDLKYLSQRQTELAGIPGDYPASEPLIIE